MRAPAHGLVGPYPDRYMTLLRIGVREHELDPDYIEWLEAVTRIYRSGQYWEPPPFITNGPPLEEKFENFPWLEV